MNGEMVTDDVTLAALSRDASIFSVRPLAVAYPKNKEELAELIAYAKTHDASLTARAGGTDMSGGPLSSSIVVSMTKYFNRGPEIIGHTAITQPGVYYRDFEKATLAKNLLLPSFPASKDICTVGGMVANNSGGEKTLALGKTKDYVDELKVVLRDGQEYTFAHLTPSELKEKMALQALEGDIYRQMFELLEKNYNMIQGAKPNVSKNSSGYNLWDVWNKTTFDLTKLFTGSQGTLGIITEIKFRLIQPKLYSRLLVIFLPDTTLLATLIPRILRYSPESFESYDDHTLKFALRYFLDIAKRFTFGNVLALLWQFVPEVRQVLGRGLPKMVLLAEFTGDDASEVTTRAEAALAAIKDLPLQARLTTSEVETKKYWTIRHESFNLLRQHVHGMHTAPFIDDIVVRPEQLPEFLPKLDTIMSQYKLIYTVAGHIGDANFHIIPLMNLADPAARAIIPELADKVYALVLAFKGSISGEHNDGLIRSGYLKQMYGSQVYDLFKQTKKIFDPDNIFNPGKKVNFDAKFAQEHIIKS